MHKLGYFSAFLLPLVVLLGHFLGGAFEFLNVAFVFIIIPLLDELVGKDRYNIPKEEVQAVSDDQFFKWVTYAWVYVQFVLVIWGAWVVSTQALSTAEWIGFTLSIALTTGGIGITVAHELGHKKSATERFYAKALLMTVSYMHFYIEHNRGHHVRVATPEDPATARKGESFYAFWLRAVFIGYSHAWQLENERMKRNGKHPLSLDNEMIRFTILPIAFAGLLWLTLSLYTGSNAWQALPFFFVQSFFAFTLLELVDYIEHYGIVRKPTADGRYERVNPLHSWNANHLVSNFFLFQLQRHSDHHAHAIKRYQVLDHLDESPQLPFGYPTMILMALIPPLWFTLMDKKLENWKTASLSAG